MTSGTIPTSTAAAMRRSAGVPSKCASGHDASPTNVHASVAPAPAIGKRRFALRAVVACETTAQP